MDDRKSFWAYIKHREIDFLPTGTLRWWLLALIVLGWAVEQYEALKNGPVLVYLLADFNKSLVEWGQVAAVAGLVYGAGAIILSRLADRVGRRPLMIWPVLAYAVISALGALTPSFWVLAFLVTSGGFMMAGMNPAVHAASRDLTPRMGRAMVYSWVSLAFTIGALMSTVVAAKTLPIWPGWRSQYWIAACLATVTALLIFVFYRDLSPRVRGQILQTQMTALRTSESPAIDDAYSNGRAVYGSTRLWLLSTVIVFWSLTYVTISGYVPTFLTQHHHLEPAKAAGVTSYFWFVFTISVFLSGWISDKTRIRKTVTAFGSITTGICLIVGASQPVDTSIGELSVIWSLTGFFAGFIYPAWCAIYSETAESVSPHGVGRAFGITATLSPIAGLVLNLGLPQVVVHWGWATWMWVAAGCCFCVSALVSFGKGPWWITSSAPETAQLIDSPSS